MAYRGGVLEVCAALMLMQKQLGEHRVLGRGSWRYLSPGFYPQELEVLEESLGVSSSKTKTERNVEY
jgi:hypothetical protein